MRDLILKRDQLHQVGETFSAKVDAVRVDRKLETPINQIEVKEADARDVTRVGQWLKSGNRRGPARGIVTQFLTGPRDLITAAVRVIAKSGRVTVRVAESFHCRVVAEVVVHPRHSCVVGVLADDVVIDPRLGNTKCRHHDFSHGESVVVARYTVSQNEIADSKPGVANGERVNRYRRRSGAVGGGRFCVIHVTSVRADARSEG